MSPFVFPWPSGLVEGRLVRRFERFVAEVKVGKSVLKVHCVNSGRMEGMVVPGARVWISDSGKPERALRHTLELMELDGQLVGANTGLPNRLVQALLEGSHLAGFERLREVRPEVAFGRGHRVDFVVQDALGPHHVEVKNCHLVYPDGAGYFPDSNSDRARSHVEALARVVAKGGRATVLFTLQRRDAQRLRPSDLHAPEFARAVRRAAKQGVAFRAVRLVPTLEGLRLDGEVPVDLEPYSIDAVVPWARALEATTGWERKDGGWAGGKLPAR